MPNQFTAQQLLDMSAEDIASSFEADNPGLDRSNARVEGYYVEASWNVLQSVPHPGVRLASRVLTAGVQSLVFVGRDVVTNEKIVALAHGIELGASVGFLAGTGASGVFVFEGDSAADMLGLAGAVQGNVGASVSLSVNLDGSGGTAMMGFNPTEIGATAGASYTHAVFVDGVPANTVISSNTRNISFSEIEHAVAFDYLRDFPGHSVNVSIPHPDGFTVVQRMYVTGEVDGNPVVTVTEDLFDDEGRRISPAPSPLDIVPEEHRDVTVSDYISLRPFQMELPNWGSPTNVRHIDGCFAAGTPIALPSGTTKPIEDIQVGDEVMAFDGFGRLQPRRVSRLMRNATTDWISLSGLPDAAHEPVFITPGHEVLTPSGEFRMIGALLEGDAGEVELVASDGSAFMAVATRVAYSASTAELFEQADAQVPVDGNAALVPAPVSAWKTYNFEVEGLHTYVAGGIRVHNDSLLDHVTSKEGVKSIQTDANGRIIGVTTFASISGETVHRVAGDEIEVETADGGLKKVTSVISQTIRYEDSDTVVTQVWRRADGTIGDESDPVGTGELSIEHKNEFFSGAQIGSAFGSALGNAIGDNVIEDVLYSAAFDTFFGSVGEFTETLIERPTISSGQVNDRHDVTTKEAADDAFNNFGTRFAGNVISAGLSQISSFVVGELIGGEGFAADLGRSVANSFVSAALSDSAAAIVDTFGWTEISSFLDIPVTSGFGSIPIGDSFSFNPVNAIGSFFASHLADSLVQAESQEAAMVGNILGSIGSVVGNVIPVIGSFIGQFIGKVFGTLLGNALFGDRDYPRALVTVGIDSNGQAYNVGNYQSFDGMPLDAMQPAADGLSEGLNEFLERFGESARFATPWGYITSIGYIAEPDYHGRQKGYVLTNPSIGTPGDVWNQSGFNTQDFNDLYKFVVMNVVTNGGITGGDAWGRRVLHYGGWTTFAELMDQLQIAVDYRSYLENKHIIDRLITEAPDSAFAVGWLVTLGQAAALGFTNPDAMHNLMQGTVNGEALHGTQYNDEIIAGAGNDALYSGLGRDLLNGGAGTDYLDGGDNLDTASYRDSFAGVTVNLETGAASGGHASGDTLVSIERLFGSDHGDVLTGDAGNNLLAGYLGDDVISGGAGDDVIEGGAGADVLDGGDDYDIASYGGSQAGVYVTLQEGATAGTGQGGDAEGDTLTGFEAISGSQHSDYLVGNSEDNMLVGNDGNDFLEGGDGADRLLGGSGTDFAVYSGSGEAISINLETGDASGGQAEGDTLDSIENIIGSAHDDVIIGNGYGNIIEGGAGADTLDGGAGDDAISYAESDAGVSVNLATNTVSGGHAEGDTISNFENVIGSNHADVITVQIGSDTVVLAGDGDDIIRVEDGGTFTPGGRIKIDGGAGVDEADFAALSGGVNVYNLYNTAGFFFGWRWSTTHVNFGSDIYNVWANISAGGVVNTSDFSEATTDYEVGVHSVEVLTATRFDDIIDFEDNTNQQIGDLGFFAQAINAGDGNDIVRGKTGHDWFKGGAGNDTITGDLGNDIIFGGAGNDVIYGEGSEQIHSFATGNLFAFFDTSPQTYQDLVDSYSPYGANDRIDGGAGNDALFGNFGDDTYVFGRGYGSDTIHDEAYINGPSAIPPGGKFPLAGPPVRTFGGNDTIEMAAGLALEDLDFLLEQGDLTIRIRGTSDQVTIKNFADTNQRVETIKFADTGTTHTIASLDVVARQLAEHASVLDSRYNEHHLATGLFASSWNAQRFLGDINNDGFVDIVGTSGTTIYASLGNITGTFGSGYTTASLNYAGQMHLADLNGDGLLDLVRMNDWIGPAIWYQGTGQTFGAWQSVSLPQQPPHIDDDPPFHPASRRADFARHFGDVNGDGFSDFIMLNGGVATLGLTSSSSGAPMVAQATYSVLDFGWGSVGDNDIPPPITSTLIGDINGDGLDDFIAVLTNGVKVAFSNGVTFDAPTTVGNLFTTTAGWTGQAPILADINGDNRDDLVGFSSSGIFVAFSLGTSFATPVNMYTGFGGYYSSIPVFAGDVNGDGYGDFAVAAPDGIRIALAKPHRTIGTRFNDVLIGNGSTPLIGFEGDDIIYGSSASEEIIGGYGADTIIGGGGSDTVSYVSSREAVTVNLAHQNASGGEGTGDTFQSIENAIGSFHNDVIFSGAGANSIDGSDGVDQLDYRFSTAAVQVSLATGIASGGYASGDVLSSIERVHGSAFNDTLTGDAGDNVLWGYLGSNTLAGLGGDDTILGGDGADQIYGGDGNDTLIGGAGADLLDGGDGFDTASYYSSAAAVAIDLAADTITGADAEGDTFVSIEQIVGSDHADVLSGDAASNMFDGGAGNDALAGRDGDDTLRGGAGNDSITGGAGADIIDGGDGVDVADYSASAAAVTINLAAGVASGGDAEGDQLSNIENIVGTDHDDTIYAGHAANNLNAGSGTDTLSYAASDTGVTASLATGSGSGGWAEGDVLAGFENLEGSANADTLYGDDGNNVLRGLGGDDSLFGGAGTDDLAGGAGADSFRGGEGADRIDGGSGGDIVWYDDSNVAVTVDLASAAPQSGGTAEGDELTGIENLGGSSFDDVLYGNAGANVIVGGDGADEIHGRDGDDTLSGGAGADIVDGGTGSDAVSYVGSSNGVTVDLLANTVAGGDAQGDTLVSIENVIGSAHTDTLSGDHEANLIDGGAGDDVIYGNNGDDTLYGRDGNDNLFGQAGADTIDGGAGTDVASYAGSWEGITVNLQTDINTGGTAEGDHLISIENVSGSIYDDVLTGDDGANTLWGWAGDDLLEGGAGADALHGGDGTDTISFSGATGGVTANLQLGTGTAGDADGDSYTGIENIVGSTFSDVLIGDAGDNILKGGAGGDTLDGGDGTDTASYAGAGGWVIVDLANGTASGSDADGDVLSSIENLSGSDHADALYGDAAVNELKGGAGDDALFGRDGADILDGGVGSDWAGYITSTQAVTVNLETNAASGGHAAGDILVSIENLWGSSHADTLVGDAGDNILRGGGGADVLNGGLGSDTVDYWDATGSVTVNLLDGTGAGAEAQGDILTSIENVIGSAHLDTIIGNAADNRIIGGAGDDHLRGGGGADYIDGGDGNDTANYDQSSSGVTVNLETNVNTGGDAQGDELVGIEKIGGSTHNDALTGNAGANTLWGNAGDDTLTGGAGADYMDGGTGLDRVSYSDSDAAVTVDLINGSAHGGFGEGDTFIGIEGAIGSAFDDNLISSAGAETLDGGDGLDQANYVFSTSAVTVNLASGTGQGGFAAGDSLANIEKVFGSSYDDVLTGDAGDNIFEGHTGNDTLDGGDGVDTASYASASAAVLVNLETGVLTGAAAGDTLISIENLIGSAHADLLEGNAVDNRLEGGEGNDTLVGGAGADVLDGGLQQDTIRYDDSDAGVTIDFIAGTGVGGHAEGDVLTSIESVVGSAHDDTFYSSDTAEQLNGLGGFDVARYDQSAAAVIVDLNFGSGVTGTGLGGAAEGDTLTSIEGVVGSVFGDTLIGDAADNMLDGRGGNDALSGGDGNDSLKGGDGDDTLDGGAGADWLVGGAGADAIDGGDGFDTVDYSQSDAGVSVSLMGTAGTVGDAAGDVLTSIERIYGSDFNDQIDGSAVGDILYGQDGDDTINAGDGDDWVDGGAGADVLDGGLGSDGVEYAGSQVGVTVDLALGTGQFGDAEGDQLSNFNKLAGSDFDDTLTGSTGNDDIWGQGGNDAVSGGAGDDALYGGDGDDTLAGGAGIDTLDGGAGSNTASYAYSAEGVNVYLGTGQAFGESGDQDTLIDIQSVEGSGHSDNLDGDAGANTLTGLAGSDVLQGMDGDDVLLGGDGSDWLVGGTGGDTLDGGADFDTADYSNAAAAVSVDLLAGVGTAGEAAGDTLISIERLIGSAFDDTLAGSVQGDFLYGEAGNDQISGGAGNDWLYGGTGADAIDGGDGFDTVLYGASDAAIDIDLAAGTGLGGHAQGDALTSIEQIEGSAFDDIIRGGAAGEALFGEGGNDQLSGGAGADQLDGGDGIDTVDYSAEAAGVDVSLADAVATDGGGAVDSLSDFENVRGSAYSDVLKGDTGSNVIIAGDGDDILHESGGNDDLQGGAGADEVRLAGARADYVITMLANSQWSISNTLTGDETTLTDVETAVFADETVTLQNTAPSLDAPLSALAATQDTAFSFTVPAATFGNAEAAFGDSLTLAATLTDGMPLPGWLSFDAGTGELSGTPANGDVGSLTIRVTATDSLGLATSADMQLDVANVNDAPVIAAPLADQTAEEAQVFSFAVPVNSFSDIDVGDSLTLSATVAGGVLPAWLSFDPLTATFSGTPATADVGDLTVDVTATDLSGATVVDTFTLTVIPPNQAPAVSTISETVDQGATLTVDLSTYVSDPEGHALSYALTSLPSIGTATLDEHLLTFDAPVDALGLQSIGFTATDIYGLTTSGTADVTVEDINFAPTLVAADASVDEGQQVTIDLAAYASDLDGNALTYALGTAPSAGSASLNGSLLTYMSAVGGFGDVPVEFTVSDGAGGVSTGSVDVTVNNINFAPTAGAASHDVAWAGTTTIDLAPLVADIDGDVLSYSLSQGPAAGSASMTGSMLTFTSPAAVGANTVTYSVSDGAGGVAQNTITFNTQPQPNSAPVAVGESASSGVTVFVLIGAPAGILANDYDPDGDPVSFHSAGNARGALQSIQVNNDINTGAPLSITWTVTAAVSGAAAGSVHTGWFDYTITDGNGAYASATVTVQHTVPAPITKPIVLDLDEDGIELVNADDGDIFFDVNGDGETERTGWAAADDGLLVFDKDMDDAATDIDEISFVGYKDGARTDLEGLLGFDSNADGLLDARDDLFGQFKVWQDANQNGISEAGEMKTLLAAGIAAIELTSDETVRVVGDNVSFGLGDYHRTDGSTGQFSDTGFGSTGMSFDTSALDAFDVDAQDAGFGADHETVRQLQAGLDEVVSSDGVARLLDGGASGTQAALVFDNGVSGLVSAMASFDAKPAGQSSINNRPDDQHGGPQLAAWVS
jgi:Ca2+-binding RTX toxin-like protein